MTVFPIGIGDRYDTAQLRILAGPDASSNVLRLQRIEDLTMVTLGNSFFHKLCSGESCNIFFLPQKNKDNKTYFRDPRVSMHKICP